jgi:hypothetical protein
MLDPRQKGKKLALITLPLLRLTPDISDLLPYWPRLPMLILVGTPLRRSRRFMRDIEQIQA